MSTPIPNVTMNNGVEVPIGQASNAGMTQRVMRTRRL